MDTLPLQFRNQLGPHLRSLRRARKMTQRELAARLGVTQARIATIEANPAAVSVGQLMTILAALDADLALCVRPARDRVARKPRPQTDW